MVDLSHEPRLDHDASQFHGQPTALRYLLQGSDDELRTHTEVYLCSLCGVVYEDDKGNVCAKKLATQVEQVLTRAQFAFHGDE